MHYLISTAGYPNIGDELIARAWLRQLAERDPEADVWLDCPNPSGAQAALAGAHPRLRCVDTVFRLGWKAPSESPWDVAAFTADALGDHGLAPRWIPGLQLFTQASTVHVMGGGYVNDRWPRHISVLAAAAWAERKGATVAVTGQGFAPMAPATAALTRELLRRIPVVDVRDQPSAELIGRPSAYTGDDLWLSPVGDLIDPVRAAEFDAVVCVPGDQLAVAPGVLTAQVVRHLERWAVDPGRTAVVECIPRVDRVVFDHLRAFVPGLAFLPWTEILQRGFPAGPHQRWFSTRFHPHMVAARAGAHGVAVPVKPGYYDVKHQSLIRAGSPWEVLEPGSDAVEDVRGRRSSSADLRRSEERIRTAKLAVADGLYGRARLRIPVPASPVDAVRSLEGVA